MGRKAARVQLSIPVPTLAEIDEYAESHYLTRSAFVTMCCSQYLMSHKVADALGDITISLRRIAANGATPEELDKLEEMERLIKMLQGSPGD
jgi:hypothetical protein